MLAVVCPIYRASGDDSLDTRLSEGMGYFRGARALSAPDLFVIGSLSSVSGRWPRITGRLPSFEAFCVDSRHRHLQSSPPATTPAGSSCEHERGKMATTRIDANGSGQRVRGYTAIVSTLARVARLLL